MSVLFHGRNSIKKNSLLYRPLLGANPFEKFQKTSILAFEKNFAASQNWTFFQISAHCGESTTNEGCYEKNHIGYGSQSPVYWTCTRIRRPNSHHQATRIIATTLSLLRVRFFMKSHGIMDSSRGLKCNKICKMCSCKKDATFVQNGVQKLCKNMCKNISKYFAKCVKIV